MKLVRKFLDAPAAAPAIADRTDDRPVFRASDSTPDRYGDRVFVQGLSLARFNQNPILLFDHNHALPVGTGEVWAEGAELFLAPTFTRSSAKGREIENLVDEGVIRTVSIGFLPIRTSPNEFGGVDFLEAELLEISFVSVPANPNALRVKTMSKKNVSALAKSLAAMIAKAADELEDEETPAAEEAPAADEKPAAEEKPADEEPPADQEKSGEPCPHCGQAMPEKSAEEPPADEEKSGDEAEEKSDETPPEPEDKSGDDEDEEKSDDDLDAEAKAFLELLIVKR